MSEVSIKRKFKTLLFIACCPLLLNMHKLPFKTLVQTYIISPPHQKEQTMQTQNTKKVRPDNIGTDRSFE